MERPQTDEGMKAEYQCSLLRQPSIGSTLIEYANSHGKELDDVQSLEHNSPLQVASVPDSPTIVIKAGIQGNVEHIQADSWAKGHRKGDKRACSTGEHPNSDRIKPTGPRAPLLLLVLSSRTHLLLVATSPSLETSTSCPFRRPELAFLDWYLSKIRLIRGSARGNRDHPDSECSAPGSTNSCRFFTCSRLPRLSRGR